MSINFKKNLNYIKTQFYILLKEFTEYKAEMYSSFFVELIYFITIILFSNVIFSNFNEFFSWNRNDYILYLIICSLSYVLIGMFIWDKNFFKILTSGNFNNYLTKPINIKLQFIFSRLAPASIAFIIFDLILLILYIIIYNIQTFNILLSNIIFLLISLFQLSIYLFGFSFEFFVKNSYSILDKNYRDFQKFFEIYPYIYFNKFPLKIFLFLFSNTLIATLLIPILRNYKIFYLKEQILFLICSIIFSCILIHFLWKKGIEKYEAFG